MNKGDDRGTKNMKDEEKDNKEDNRDEEGENKMPYMDAAKIRRKRRAK